MAKRKTAVKIFSYAEYEKWNRGSKAIEKLLLSRKVK
jgi:hypothetical protein